MSPTIEFELRDGDPEGVGNVIRHTGRFSARGWGAGNRRALN